MAAGNRGRESRESRERARLYRARQEFREGQARRRARDNVAAGIVGGLIVAAAVAGQFVYFGVGPGAPAPEPTSTPAPSATEEPAPDPAPADPTTTPAP